MSKDANGVEITEKGIVRISWKMLVGLIVFIFFVGGWVFWVEAKSYSYTDGKALERRVEVTENGHKQNEKDHKKIDRKLNLLLDKMNIPRTGIEE
jgi:nitrogen fixation-related uncharacterized protein